MVIKELAPIEVPQGEYPLNLRGPETTGPKNGKGVQVLPPTRREESSLDVSQIKK